MKNKLFSKAEFKGVIDKEKRLVHVIASTGVIDRHGESVNPNGWHLENFLKSPVVLVAHDYWSLPVGSAEKVWVENNELHMNILVAKGTQAADEVWALLEGGHLRAVSVGFKVSKWGVSGKDPYTIMEQELLEVSWVAVPANPEALVQDGLKAKFETLFTVIKSEGTQRYVQMSEQELRELISEEFNKAIEGKKIVEEKIVEKTVYVEGTKLSECAYQMLLEIRKHAEKAVNKSNHTVNLLNSLLNVKTSIKGGDTT